MKKPKWFNIALLGIIITTIAASAAIRSCWYNKEGYIEQHTPVLEITAAQFDCQPITNGNVTGIFIAVTNISNACAKNVTIDFVNDNGMSKIGKLKYFKQHDIIAEPLVVKAGDMVIDGWRPQGLINSPAVYKNNEKQYKVNIFIDWESDKGDKYSLAAGYHSVPHGFSKEVQFKKDYLYTSFKNAKEIEKKKQELKDYLLDCVFRPTATTHFGQPRPPVPFNRDHPFRLSSTTCLA